MSTYKYENVCGCVCVFVFSRISQQFGIRFDTLWQTCALWPRKGFKTIKFQKKVFSAELLPFFVLNMLKYGIIAKPLLCMNL